jgi:hypothetical protein
LLAGKRGETTLRELFAVRFGVVGQELCPVQVVLSRLCTHISGVRNGITLIASDEDVPRGNQPSGKSHLAKRHGGLAAVQRSVTLVCYPVAVGVLPVQWNTPMSCAGGVAGRGALAGPGRCDNFGRSSLLWCGERDSGYVRIGESGRADRRGRNATLALLQ